MVGDAFQGLDIFGGRIAFDKAIGDFLHPRGTLATRCALAAGFVGVEGVEVVQHPRHSTGVVQDDHSPGTGHRATCCEGIEVHGNVPEAEFFLAAIGVLDFENLIGFENFRR